MKRGTKIFIFTAAMLLTLGGMKAAYRHHHMYGQTYGCHGMQHSHAQMNGCHHRDMPAGGMSELKR